MLLRLRLLQALPLALGLSCLRLLLHQQRLQMEGAWQRLLRS